MSKVFGKTPSTTLARASILDFSKERKWIRSCILDSANWFSRLGYPRIGKQMKPRLNARKNGTGRHAAFDRSEAVDSLVFRARLALDASRKGRRFPPIPDMAKGVIFWCAVFAVVVIGADRIGESLSARQVMSPSGQPVPPVSTTSSVAEQPTSSVQPKSWGTPNVADAAERSSDSNR
jgi:hypothetical protein